MAKIRHLVYGFLFCIFTHGLTVIFSAHNVFICSKAVGDQRISQASGSSLLLGEKGESYHTHNYLPLKLQPLSIAIIALTRWFYFVSCFDRSPLGISVSCRGGRLMVIARTLRSSEELFSDLDGFTPVHQEKVLSFVQHFITIAFRYEVTRLKLTDHD